MGAHSYEAPLGDAPFVLGTTMIPFADAYELACAANVSRSISDMICWIRDVVPVLSVLLLVSGREFEVVVECNRVFMYCVVNDDVDDDVAAAVAAVDANKAKAAEGVEFGTLKQPTRMTEAAAAANADDNVGGA